MTPPILIFLGVLGLFSPWPIIAGFMILYGVVAHLSGEWGDS